MDLHFHGAFGIDLMRAESRQLDRLSNKLWQNGVAAFCPTTLSTQPKELKAALKRLGTWIRRGNFPGAIPLGIHLEGPFISRHACGAHPSHAIQRFSKKALLEYWEASLRTLKIITVAPEILAPSDLKFLTAWAKKNRIILSLGHTQATETQAQSALAAGFTNVTHLWNAMKFHHRDPGAMAAVLGAPDVYLELIVDRVHVSLPVIRWTRQLHPKRICFISDCVPAPRFGTLKTRYQGGVARLKSGSLAGGGMPLTESFKRWAQAESRATGIILSRIVRSALSSITTDPLKALGVSASHIKNRKIQLKIARSGRLHISPLGLKQSG